MALASSDMVLTLHVDHGGSPGAVNCQERAIHQIQLGKRLASETGASVDDALELAHWLIPDGAAARQGGDPAWVLQVPALRDFYPVIMRIEREAVLGWTDAELEAVVMGLPAADAARLMSWRKEAA